MCWAPCGESDDNEWAYNFGTNSLEVLLWNAVLSRINPEGGSCMLHVPANGVLHQFMSTAIHGGVALPVT